MSLLTMWGYVLTDDSLTALPELVSEAAFNELTAGKYASDTRLSAVLAAASAAVRNYCGWHLAPSLACEYRADSLHTGHTVQLPSRYVSSVESVAVNGEVLPPSAYVLKPGGRILLRGKPRREGWNDIVVLYNAGLPSVPAEIAGVVATVAMHALASSGGIQSESAGGESVTYASSWLSGSATSLPTNEQDALSPYVVKGVW